MSSPWKDAGGTLLYFRVPRGSDKHQEHQGPSGYKLKQSRQLGRAVGEAVRARQGKAH